MSELFCKVSVNNVPDPNISGLEPSEKIACIYTHLQEFFPHFQWVYEQQTDLQLPTSPLLSDLSRFRAGSRNQSTGSDFRHQAQMSSCHIQHQDSHRLQRAA
ncbi:hypothetical protein CesoFtcFv8_010641 [Champsocephalus esox]|nr:hypothetical protein CesoFtcFv8_010641 [Champsocephalus esox]